MTGFQTRPTPQQIVAAREVLCVEPDATRDEIVAVWRAAVRLTHPDTARPEAADVAKRMNQQVNEARDILLAAFDDDARLRVDEDFMTMLRGDPPRDQTVVPTPPAPPPPAAKIDPAPPPPPAEAFEPAPPPPPPPPTETFDPAPPPPPRTEPAPAAPAAAAPPPPPVVEPDPPPPRVEEPVAKHATAEAPAPLDDTANLGADAFAPSQNGHGAHGTVGFDVFAPLPPRPPVPPAPPRRPNAPRVPAARPPLISPMNGAPAETAATTEPQFAPPPAPAESPVAPATNGHAAEGGPIGHAPEPPSPTAPKLAADARYPTPQPTGGLKVRPAIVIVVGIAILLLVLVAVFFGVGA